MTENILKKTVFFSLLAHLTVFSAFSFSFGYKVPKIDYTAVSFWGAILQPLDLMAKDTSKMQKTQDLFLRKSSAKLLNNVKKDYPLISDYYSKPAAHLLFSGGKIDFVDKLTPAHFLITRKESSVIFYPQLPYHFLLYFKDRQVAYIELKFNIISNEFRNYIDIRRKISSGNLEADLLSMRYIKHYLFIQQANFPSNNWQQVKIELSTKADRK